MMYSQDFENKKKEIQGKIKRKISHIKTPKELLQLMRKIKQDLSEPGLESSKVQIFTKSFVQLRRLYPVFCKRLGEDEKKEEWERIKKEKKNLLKIKEIREDAEKFTEKLDGFLDEFAKDTDDLVIKKKAMEKNLNGFLDDRDKVLDHKEALEREKKMLDKQIEESRQESLKWLEDDKETKRNARETKEELKNIVGVYAMKQMDEQKTKKPGNSFIDYQKDILNGAVPRPDNINDYLKKSEERVNKAYDQFINNLKKNEQIKVQDDFALERKHKTEEDLKDTKSEQELERQKEEAARGQYAPVPKPEAKKEKSLKEKIIAINMLRNRDLKRLTPDGLKKSFENIEKHLNKIDPLKPKLKGVTEKLKGIAEQLGLSNKKITGLLSSKFLKDSKLDILFKANNLDKSKDGLGKGFFETEEYKEKFKKGLEKVKDYLNGEEEEQGVNKKGVLRKKSKENPGVKPKLKKRRKPKSKPISPSLSPFDLKLKPKGSK